MLKINLSIMIAAVLAASNVSAATGTKQKCELNFEFDSAVVNSDEINQCLDGLEAAKVEFLHIFATASYPGTLMYNRGLSERRANSIEAVLRDRFPEATIEAQSGGENPLGQKAKVFVYLASADPAATVQPAQVDMIRRAPAAESGDNLNRVTARGGIDHFRQSSTTYSTVGAEYARLSRPYKKHFYGELGAGAYQHSSDDMLDLYSVNAFVGGYAKRGVLVAGVRAVAGNLSTEHNSDNTFNGGAELRAGFETDRYTVMSVGGISKEFNTVGLDLGVKF